MLKIFSVIAMISVFAWGETINKDVSKNGGSLDISRFNQAKVVQENGSWFFDFEALTVTNGSDGDDLRKHFEELVLVASVGYFDSYTNALPVKLNLIRPLAHKNVLKTNRRIVLTSASLFGVKGRILLPEPERERDLVIRFESERNYGSPTVSVELLWSASNKTWEVIYGPLKDIPTEFPIVSQDIQSFAVDNHHFETKDVKLSFAQGEPDPWKPKEKPAALPYFDISGDLPKQRCLNAEPLSLHGSAHAVRVDEQLVTFVTLWKKSEGAALNPFGLGCDLDGSKTEVKLGYGYAFEEDEKPKTMASINFLAFIEKLKAPGVGLLTATKDKGGAWQLEPGWDEYAQPYFKPW